MTYKVFSLLLFLAYSSVSHAALISYDISVEVTSTPLAPGSFASNPWNFTSSVFNGTFTADDTVSGSISNLNLVIGGLDIAATHTSFIQNIFDPLTLVLSFGALDPSGNESAVFIGSTFGIGAPANYAVAIENNSFSPLDPFYLNTQNWVGTYTVNADHNVPEPTSIALLGLGLAGLGFSRKKKAA